MARAVGLLRGTGAELDALTLVNGIGHVMALDLDDDARPRIFDGAVAGGRKIAWVDEALTSFTGVLAGEHGGTGVANTGKTITLGGNLTLSGAHALTLTQAGTTNVTLPTTGTLATLAGAESLSNKTLVAPILAAAGPTPFTAGSVLIAGTGGVVSQDNNNIYWDTVNKRFGVGTAIPAEKLHVLGVSAAPAIGSSNAGLAWLVENSGNNGINIGFDYNGGTSPYGWLQSQFTGGVAVYYALTLNPLGGNIGIGTTTPAVSLDVNGLIRPGTYTVATLPAGVAGAIANVSDALAPVWGAAVAGGGAVNCSVRYNGTAWTVWGQ